MQDVQEDKLTSQIIDLNISESEKLDESFLRMFGNVVKWLMKRTFGESEEIPVIVRGTPTQVDTFTKVLASEKRYLDSYKKYGLHDPRTYDNKYTLDQSIKNFERATSIKWPFK